MVGSALERQVSVTVSTLPWTTWRYDASADLHVAPHSSLTTCTTYGRRPVPPDARSGHGRRPLRPPRLRSGPGRVRRVIRIRPSRDPRHPGSRHRRRRGREGPVLLTPDQRARREARLTGRRRADLAADRGLDDVRQPRRDADDGELRRSRPGVGRRRDAGGHRHPTVRRGKRVGAWGGGRRHHRLRRRGHPPRLRGGGPSDLDPTSPLDPWLHSRTASPRPRPGPWISSPTPCARHPVSRSPGRRRGLTTRGSRAPERGRTPGRKGRSDGL